ncbi:MAG: hypothetical protein ACOVOJ_01955, partial [Pirellula sp.]
DLRDHQDYDGCSSTVRLPVLAKQLPDRVSSMNKTSKDMGKMATAATAQSSAGQAPRFGILIHTAN